MEPKKTQAFNLREQGKTYKEISGEVGVALSTLSFWFKNNEASSLVRKQNTDRARPLVTERLRKYNSSRQKTLENTYKIAEDEAGEAFQSLMTEPLFISGISIYLGQGNKHSSPNQINISSRNPGILRIFKRFCIHYLNVNQEKIKFWPLLYENSLVSEVCDWWKEELSITVDQFYKPQIMKGRVGEERLLYGVGNIIIGSKLHKVKLEHWAKLAIAVLGE